MAYLKIVAAAILVVIVVLGIMAYDVFRTPAEASRTIEAIPLPKTMPVHLTLVQNSNLLQRQIR